MYCFRSISRTTSIIYSSAPFFSSFYLFLNGSFTVFYRLYVQCMDCYSPLVTFPFVRGVSTSFSYCAHSNKLSLSWLFTSSVTIISIHLQLIIFLLHFHSTHILRNVHTTKYSYSYPTFIISNKPTSIFILSTINFPRVVLFSHHE